MEFEDILKQVGGYGAYQKKLLFLFLVPSTIIFSFLCMNTFFMLSEPEHWCTVEPISHLPHDQQKFFSRPLLKKQNTTDEDEEQEVQHDSCHYYDINYDLISDLYSKNQTSDLMNRTLRFNWSNTSEIFELESAKVKSCNSWTFDDSNYDETAVTYLNLVCGKDHWKSLILTIHGIGEVVGNPLFGSLSDKFGRHKVFFICLIFAISSSISPLIFKGIYVFAIFRFINSFTAATLFNLPYIIMTEIVAPEYRTRMIGIGATCWTFGMCILPLFAWLARDWVILTIIPTILIIPMFAYWKFLPESPRWLIAQERYDEAYKVVARIATENGKEIPYDLLDQLRSVNSVSRRKYSNAMNGSTGSNKKLDDPNGSLMDILRKPGLRFKFLILTLAWTASVTTYRGLTLNFENFHGNEFVNWFLLSIVEFPSNWFSWYLMGSTRLGRRWCHSLTMTLGGLALCLPVLLPSAWTSSVMIASLVGKFLCNMAYNVVYQQTAELFPTPVRNSGMSYTTAIAAGANFALPYLALLGKVRVWIPLVFMGLVSITSGIAASFLPETLNENLPQTIADGDDFGRGMKYFSLAKNLTRKDDKERKVSLIKSAMQTSADSGI